VLTPLSFAIYLLCGISGGVGLPVDFKPSGNQFWLREFFGIEESHQRKYVNYVEIDRCDVGSKAARSRSFDLLDKGVLSNLEAQIHKVPTFFASTVEPLAPKSEQPSDEGGADRSDCTSNGDDKGYVFTLHVILVAALSGLVVSFLICVPVGFAMWRLERRG
jgi:hypothetical protein